MSAKYQLPPDLGGDECVLLPGPVVLENLPAVKVRTDSGRYLIVQTFDLTPIPVKPASPEEPPVNSVIAVSNSTSRFVFTRGYTGWMMAGEDRWFTWAEVVRHGTPVLLVPDPMADAPGLPYETTSIDGLRTHVDIEASKADRNHAWISFTRGHAKISAHVNRSAGLAILAACDESEARAQS